MNARTYHYQSQPSPCMYTHTGLLMHTHERGSRKDLFILYIIYLYIFSNMYMPILVKNHEHIFLAFRSPSLLGSGCRSQGTLLLFYYNNPCSKIMHLLCIFWSQYQNPLNYVLTWDWVCWWDPVQAYSFVCSLLIVFPKIDTDYKDGEVTSDVRVSELDHCRLQDEPPQEMQLNIRRW